MDCTVHCLVSGSDELSPLKERIAEAGIADESVRVVWRGRLASHGGPALRKNEAPWNPWGEMLVPACWWWRFATAAWSAVPPGDVPELGKSRVTALCGGKRRCPRHLETESE